jgi:hypothetical protein
MAYLSNEVDVLTTQLYLRPFDSNKSDTPSGPALQVTNLKGGANGPTWRQDGKEIFFLNRDREVMAVDVTTTPKLQAGMPHVLFKITDPLVGGGDVSPDGERFVVALSAK